MKVITLNCLHGPHSTSKIIRDIEEVLHDRNVEFLHVQESGRLIGKNYVSLSGWFSYRVYYVVAHVTGKQYGTGVIPYLKFRFIVHKYKPDVVHIHCPNAFSIHLYKTLNFLKKHKIPTVITNHAEFFYTGNCSHAEECTQFVNGCMQCGDYKQKLHSRFFDRSAWAWKKMKKSFEGYGSIKMVAVSPWVYGRMQMSPICNHLPSCVILNGIDKNVFKPNPEKRPNRTMKKVLFVTASFTSDADDLKGGRYVLELARMCLDLPVRFIVIGNNSVSTQDIPDNMELLGVISDQKILAYYYSDADVTLITSKRETFGMACAESLSCGTPVVGFRNGGSDSIALSEYSAFVEFGNTAALKKEMLRMLNQEAFEPSEIARAAHERYASEVMATAYKVVYDELMKG